MAKKTRKRAGEEAQVAISSGDKPRDVRPEGTVTVFLDREVVDWLQSKGEGHLTRINDILLNFMEAERAAGSRSR